MDVEVAAQASERPTRHRRWVTVLIGIAAITAALDATLQLQASKQEERSDFAASRDRSISQEMDVTSQGFRGLVILVNSDLLGFNDTINAHLKSENAAAHIIGVAERRAVIELADVTTAIKETPSDSRLPDFARDALAPDGLEQINRLNIAVRANLSKAASFQTKSDRFGLALFLVAIATALLALAGVAPPSRAASLAVGVAFIFLAGNIAVTSFAVVAQ